MRLVVLSLALLVVGVERAEACSCGYGLVSPANHTADVPLNVALVLEQSPGAIGAITLRDAQTQAVIPLDVQPFPAHGWVQYAIARPTVPLAPSTKYEVYDYNAPYPSGEFTTGDRDDDTPPAPVLLNSFKATNIEGRGAKCFECDGPDDHVQFRLDLYRDVDVVFTTYEYYRQGEASGVVVPNMFQGSNFLFCTQLLPAIEPMETYCARVTAYDIAGNATVSSEACTQAPADECKPLDPTDCDSPRECKPAALSEAPGGGCDAGGHGGWILVVIFTCGGLVRRLRLERDAKWPFLSPSRSRA